jgi:hypothetical protein
MSALSDGFTMVSDLCHSDCPHRGIMKGKAGVTLSLSILWGCVSFAVTRRLSAVFWSLR